MVDESHPETEKYEVEFPVVKAEEVQILNKIGSGTFGVVFHGFSNALGHVAIKVCKDENDVKKLQKEVRTTLRYGAHPNIVKVFGCYDDPDNGISFVLEYMSGGTLENVVLNREDLLYCIDHIVSWMYQISSAVTHMHQCNVMHRDLKPANILMNDRFTKLKVCDLGEARVLGPSEYYTKEAGTPMFMAPEVMTSNTYTNRVDVYSMGMIIWFMCARRYPSFMTQFKTRQALMEAIVGGKRPSPLPVIDEINDIIETCMAGDPENRVDAVTLRDVAVRLVRRYPLGQKFLRCLVDSKTLKEPINIRGDDTAGYAMLEDSSSLSQTDPMEYMRKESIKMELQLHQTHSVRGGNWIPKESPQFTLPDSRLQSFTRFITENTEMEYRQATRFEKEMHRGRADVEEVVSEEAIQSSLLDTPRSYTTQFSPVDSLAPALSSNDSSRSSMSSEERRKVDELDKKPQDEQEENSGLCTSSQDTDITSNRRFLPIDSIQISACRRTTSSESSVSEKPVLEDSKRVSSPRHSVSFNRPTSTLPTENIAGENPSEDRGNPVDGLVKYDSSPKTLTNTTDAWFLNSTRIERNIVKNRKSVFEPTEEEQ